MSGPFAVIAFGSRSRVRIAMEDGRKHRALPDHYGLMSSPRGMTGKVIALLFISLAAYPQTGADIGGAAHEVLAEHCLSCHGSAKTSGLDLRNREALLRGGVRGPAVVAGQAESSMLYQVAAHLGDLKMPPGSAHPLPDDQLDILRRWIDAGSPYPMAESASGSDLDEEWWSFKTPRRPEAPEVKDADAANPIDAFVFKKWEQKGLRHAPTASKQVLARRAYFDLIGLPPTPEEVNQFVSDESPDAYKKLVDRLLESKHYGERWGRHWLDVVRYADSGGFETDEFYPEAWRYRDYVIKSFNEDKPFDRFVQEQIAADELWPDNLDLHDSSYAIRPEKVEHLEARVGTGLYTFGTAIGESYLETPQLLYERFTDWVDTTGAAFMGLTVGCARCHDHKFDPITQEEYFRLQAIFAASQPARLSVVTKMTEFHRSEAYPRYIALDESRNAYELFLDRVKQRLVDEKKKEFDAAAAAAFDVPEEDRSAEQKKLAAPLVEAVAGIKPEEQLSSEEETEKTRLQLAIADAVMAVPRKDASHSVRFDALFDIPSAMVLGPVLPELIPEIHVLERGDLGSRKAKVGPGLPASLSRGDEFENRDPNGPRYRKKLALWLTSPEHPLVARVIVNRLWQWHFGRGIVGSANDFGRQGQPPTHPELLDWLAAEFVARGWSLKSMHRLMMTSHVYQMSSQFSSRENLAIDEDNRYLWRANRRRLEAEAVWDAIHAAAGTLNRKMGGRPFVPPLSDAELAPLRNKWWWTVPADPADHSRRGVYMLARRTFPFPMFDKFDTPDPAVSSSGREVTTVAPQSLFLLNNPIVFRQAMEFAGRLVREAGEDPDARVDLLWRISFARAPTDAEKREALELLGSGSPEGWKERPDNLPASLEGIDPAAARALTELCLTVFNLNEFLFVD